MEMTGEQSIPVDQRTVWAALNDPAVLKACIPGCESIEPAGENEYKVAMTAAVGPVRAKFNGKLLLSNIDPPNSYSLSFEGSGGAAGFGKGSADVRLTTDGAATKLSYSAKAQVGGKLAQVGSRLIDGVAKKMADDFFNRFKQTVSPPAASAATASGGDGAASAAGSGSAGTSMSASASSASSSNRPAAQQTDAASPAGAGAGGALAAPAPGFNPIWIVGVVIVLMFAIALTMGH
jgi:carbon monoxide dehydrogenase subunit G